VKAVETVPAEGQDGGVGQRRCPAGRIVGGVLRGRLDVVAVFSGFTHVSFEADSRHPATAIGHGHVPAPVTTALNAPRSVDPTWNKAFPAPGLL
jgi:hypothetical protein